MRKMLQKILPLALIIALSSCGTSTPDTTASSPTPVAKSETPTSNKTKNKAKSCICVKLWMPVCGDDNKTYGNSCEADCAGVKYTVGACKDKLQDV